MVSNSARHCLRKLMGVKVERQAGKVLIKSQDLLLVMIIFGHILYKCILMEMAELKQCLKPKIQENIFRSNPL